MPKFTRSARTGEDDGGGVQFAPATMRGRARRMHVDRVLLDRAAEVLDDIEQSDLSQKVLAVQALRSIACDLWPSVAKATVYHHSILSLIEALVGSIDALSDTQASALRGAFHDLGAPVLTESHLDVIRSQFIDAGHNPLALFSSALESEDAED